MKHQERGVGYAVDDISALFERMANTLIGENEKINHLELQKEYDLNEGNVDYLTIEGNARDRINAQNELRHAMRQTLKQLMGEGGTE